MSDVYIVFQRLKEDFRDEDLSPVYYDRVYSVMVDDKLAADLVDDRNNAPSNYDSSGSQKSYFYRAKYKLNEPF